MEVRIKKNKWFSHDSIEVLEAGEVIESYDINRIEFGEWVKSSITSLLEGINLKGAIDLSGCSKLKCLPSDLTTHESLSLLSCSELVNWQDNLNDDLFGSLISMTKDVAPN